MRWLRSPSVHFVLMGVALFALERATAPAPPAPERPVIVITAAHLAEITAKANRVTASPDHNALLEQAIDEEILYREARAHLLDRDDQSIRWHLAEKMRFLAEGENDDQAPDGVDETLYHKAAALELDREDPLVRGILVDKMRFLLKRTAPQTPPDDRALAAYLADNADRFRQPARVSFHHVFLARDRHAGALDRDAQRLLAAFRATGTPPAEAVRLGDAFPVGPVLRGQSARDLTRSFGVTFAEAALALPPGTWAIVPSVYGAHLVWVDEQQPARMPELAAVRSRVLAALVEERQEAALVLALRTLRDKYIVRIEGDTGTAG